MSPAEVVPSFEGLARAFLQSDEGVEFFLDAVEKLPMAVALLRPAANDFEVAYANRAARPVAASEPAPVAASPLLSDALGAVLAKPRHVHLPEYSWGDSRVWEGDLHPLTDDRGRLRHVLLIATDVTGTAELRATAEREQQARAASLADHAATMTALQRAKSDFLLLASHELRSPLTVIRGYISMLADGSLGELPPAADGVLPAVLAKADHMGLLISEMLQAARLENGDLDLGADPLRLDAIARDVVNKMGALARPGQAVSFRSTGGPLPIRGDRLRVETILLNLVDNGLKYTIDGGEVRVTASQHDGFAVISVRDQGIGISPEEIPRLFTSFGRIVNDQNSHVAGTGLGLYVSQAMARMHGGDISVESTPGKGSQFRLRIPLASDAAPAGQSETKGASR